MEKPSTPRLAAKWEKKHSAGTARTMPQFPIHRALSCKETLHDVKTGKMHSNLGLRRTYPVSHKNDAFTHAVETVL